MAREKPCGTGEGDHLDRLLTQECERAQRCLEEAGVMMCVLDAEGRVQYSNRRLRDLLGQASGDLAGREWPIAVLEADAQEPARQALAELLRGEGGFYGEWPVVDAEGVSRMVAWNNGVVRGDDGQARWLVLSGSDLSEHYEREEQLRRSHVQESILNRLLGIGVTDASLREKLSACLEQVLTVPWIALRPKGGIFIADNDNRNLRLLVHKGLPKELQSLCRNIAFGRCLCGRAAEQERIVFTDHVDEQHEIRYPGMAPHGHYSVPMRSGERLLGVLVLYVDPGHTPTDAEHLFLTAVANTMAGIIERSWAEEALRTSEDRLRTIVRYEINGILVTDPAGTILFCNPAAEDLLGRDEEALLGEPFEAPERTVNGDFVFHDAVGEERHVEISEVGTRWDGQAARLVVLHDVTERQRYQQTLAHQATHDELTGLPNRNLFQDRADQAIAQVRRGGDRLAVFFLDLDQFKLINDTLGHGAGDEVIAQVAERLAGSVRAADTVARIGGDEFVLLFREFDDDNEVVRLADRLLAGIGEPLEVAGRQVRVGCSIGISLYPDDGTTTEVLLRNADVAMYRAKELGRFNYQFYTRELNRTVEQRLTLQQDLQNALDAGQFHLVYQPQIDVRSGRIKGVEALLRWQHPVRGLIMPEEFVPVAEEAGLMPRLGEWVLGEAALQARAWRDRGLPAVVMGVNISARQLEHGRLDDTVSGILERTGLPPEHLELELTESSLTRAGNDQYAIIRALRDHGVRIAVDNFGTGCSNLAVLQRYPLDRLKIDRSFIQHLTVNADDAAITLTLLAMAHTLGLEMVAEGVEKPAQARFLQRKGCDLLQGYFLQPPLPAEQVAGLLEAGGCVSLGALDKGDEGEGLRILVLDDEPSVTRALNRALSREGFAVTAVNGIAEAFEALAAKPFEVALVDQRMPQMSGVEFLRRIKRLYPECARVAISAYSDFDAITAAFNQGIIERFIAKPWEEEELFGVIEAVAARHGGGDVAHGS